MRCKAQITSTKAMLSSELINKIGLLFSQEERDALEFEQGNRKMTIEKQVKYYFGDLFPFTLDEDRFLDGYALTIQKNIGLIYKISKLKIYSGRLADERGFRRTSGSFSRSSTDNQNNSINNTQGIKEYLKHGQTRSGGTERGDDYEGIEELYTLQDKKDLETDLRLVFKGVDQANKGVGNQLDVLTKRSLLKSNDQENIDEQIDKKKTEIRELPSWTTVTSSSDKTKSRDSSISEQQGFQIGKTDSSTVSASWDFIDSDNVINTLQADIYDLRNSFWNSFYCLFRDFQPCR